MKLKKKRVWIEFMNCVLEFINCGLGFMNCGLEFMKCVLEFMNCVLEFMNCVGYSSASDLFEDLDNNDYRLLGAITLRQKMCEITLLCRGLINYIACVSTFLVQL